MTQTKGTRLRAGMVKIVALIVCVLLTRWTACRAEAQMVRENASSRPVLFLANESLPPLNFMKDGKPAGLVVDLANAMARRMHRPVEIRLMSWAEAQQLVLNGGADALLQINASPERLKVYDFSEPLLTSEFSIFTSSERPGVTSFFDLRGLRVGVERLGLPDHLLRQDPEIKVQNIHDFLQGFTLLTAGELDAVVVDRRVGSYVLAENHIRGLKVTEEPISRSDSAIAVRKGNSSLLEEINSALADIRRDGTYERIVKSWQSKEVVFKTVEQMRQENYLITAISAALIFALLGIAVLVREIKRRKRIEATLRESEARFRSLFELSLDGIFAVDSNGRFLKANLAAEQMSGYSGKELQELTFMDICAPACLERTLFTFQEGLKGQSAEIETAMIHKDGRHLDLLIAGSPILSSGKVEGIFCIVRDITEKKHAEQALKESEEKFRAFFNTTAFGAAKLTLEGRFFEVNGRFCEITGYGREELLKMTPQDLTHPEDREAGSRYLSEFLRGQHKEYGVEKRYIRKDGRVIWVQVNAAMIFDAFGTPLRSAGIIQDITERKQAEEALRLSEEKFALAFANNPAAIAMTRLEDGLFLEVNDTWVALNGYSREEVIGLSARRLPIWPTTDAAAHFVQELHDKGSLHGWEQEFLSRSGEVFTTQLSAQVLTVGGEKVILSTLVDITERKRAEATLRQREEEFRALVENAPDVISLFDRNLRRIYVSSQVRENTGQDSSLMMGKSLSEAGYPDSFAQPLDAALQNVLATGREETVELDYEAPKVRIWVQIRCAPLRAEDGSVERVMTIGRDITERKLMEEELRKSRDGLDLRVQERTAELQASNKALLEYAAKLERLNEELQDFAFVAAHDLQEPLRKIQTFCDMAVKRCEPAMDNTGKEYLSKVVKSASRMRELLHDLLQFSRVAEKPELFKEVDLGRIVREAAELFEEDLKESGGLIEIEELPAIEADEAKMLRLFQDLIGNALKYRREEAPRIKIHAKRNGGRYEIYVEDNGIGFDQLYTDRIFKPFQRLHRRDEYGGAGMGLAICRKVVEWHGGSIRAESEPGKGSRFIISLPARQ